MSGGAISTAIAGRTPLGGLGSKPWLQKVAVFLVACGLTVASVDAFRVASRHNGHEILNLREMQDEVSATLEIRILRVISGVFVWLAQVQTLMRLFPRRKEKLIIKWFGFSLILCDLIFSCLNNFLASLQYRRRSPRNYQDAIPALSYLFQLAISLLYMAWVSYYVVTKKRYAFFIPDQLNMLVIAVLALVSIAIPVAFFVADISVPRVAGWGDFLRWVGSAAASILVWEWVDRIEVVERDEKKDGILGREVFDEDELPTSEDRFTSSSSRRGSGSDYAGKKKEASLSWLDKRPALGALTQNLARKRKRKAAPASDQPGEKTLPSTVNGDSARRPSRRQQHPSDSSQLDHRPLSPPSRTDNNSAESTVYAVHYHNNTTPVAQRPRDTAQQSGTSHEPQVSFAPEPTQTTEAPLTTTSKPLGSRLLHKSVPGWTLAGAAFKRRKRSPPIEVKEAMSLNAMTAEPSQGGPAAPLRVSLRDRFSTLRRGLGDSDPTDAASSNARPSEPTVIPAPPRGHTWSPEISRHSPINALQNAGEGSALYINPALQRCAGQSQSQSQSADAAHNPPAQDYNVSPALRSDSALQQAPAQPVEAANQGTIPDHASTTAAAHNAPIPKQDNADASRGDPAETGIGDARSLQARHSSREQDDPHAAGEPLAEPGYESGIVSLTQHAAPATYDASDERLAQPTGPGSRSQDGRSEAG